MWEYFITKSDMWYHIFRQKEVNWIKITQRLQKDSYTSNREFAKTFYNLTEVEWVYIIARRKGDAIELKYQAEKKSDVGSTSQEKQSRSEF